MFMSLFETILGLDIEVQWNTFTPKMAIQEGWSLVMGGNQYIYIWIYNVEWPFQRGWPLVRVASQKKFHCIY